MDSKPPTRDGTGAAAPGKSGKVRVRDKDATRERLLEAAEQVFAEKGYYGAVVDDIIRVSDSSKGGFYFHFPNKEAIFLALINLMVPKLEAAVERAIGAERDPIAQLDAALRTALDLFTRYRRLSKILLVEAAGLGRGVDQKLMQTRGRFAAMIRAHLDRAVAAGAIAPLDTDLAAWACFGAINEIVVRWLVTRQPDRLESLLPELRRLLLQAVGVAPASARPTSASVEESNS
jgi:AcrR family transcriptional regulator